MIQPTTILLVEDNPADAEYCKVMLPAPKYSLIEATSLAEAIDCARDQRVDVVLLDLSLPDSQGLETLIKLVSHRTELPIVILTGMEDISCVIDALRAGAHDYIVKSRLSAEGLAGSISHAMETKKRQRTDRDLLERSRLTILTAAISQSLLQATTMSEMLSGCGDAMVAQLHAALVRIWTLHEASQILTLQTSCGLHVAQNGIPKKIAVGESRVGLIASVKKPQLIDSLQRESGVSASQLPTAEEVTAFAGYPLMVGDRLLGVMEMYASEVFSDLTLSALTAVADQIALGIDRRIATEEIARLATIIECSADAIISRTLDGIVLSWNPAAERIYGFRAEEMIGKNISHLMPTEQFLEITEKLRRGEYIEHFETTRQRQDGGVINVSLSVSPIRDISGTVTGASTIIHDITKRKKAEQFLLAQNNVTVIVSESNSLAEAAPRLLTAFAQAMRFDVGAIWCLDREDLLLRCVDIWHQPDLNISELDTLSRHVTFAAGVSLPGRVLLTGKPVWIPDIATDGGVARAQAALNCGLHAAAAFPIVLGTQVLGIIEFFTQSSEEPDPQVLQMMASIGSQIGQFMDRKHAERVSLQSSHEQLRIGQAIMENAPIGIVWLDKNLVISGANAEFSEQFGLHHGELRGTFFFQLQTAIPTERLIDVVRQGIPYNSNNFGIVFGGVEKPREAFCDLTIWPIKDDSNQIIGLVILTVEVTERVKLAKQREDFVATLTHDLKNPLIGQDRMLELMVDGRVGPLQTEQTEMLSLLRTGTQELLNLIGTLLEVYRYEEGAAQLRFESLDGKKLVTECVAQWTHIAQAKGIKLSTTFPEADQMVFADQRALKRVLMNLLDNAIKFTTDNGVIDVRCECTADKFTLTIEDSGSGVSIDELRALFQRFSQTTAGRKFKAATGLGLYLCRQIVEAHGGEITCESKEGVGTIFVVTLPAAGSGSPRSSGNHPRFVTTDRR